LFKELRNGDEISLLRECDDVEQKDEIGFVFVVLIDFSKKAEPE